MQNRVDPSWDSIVAMYENLWGQPAGSVVPTSPNIPDGVVGYFRENEVSRRLARLKAVGDPVPYGVTKKCSTRTSWLP